MADKLMLINKIALTADYKQWLKRLETQLNREPIKIQ